MDFIQHTTHWVKGEIFEATLFGSFGLLTIVCSVLFWKFGETPNSKAVILPFAIVGLFFLVTALSGIASNKKKLVQYKEAFQKDPFAFVQSEKKRVENFQYLYKITILIASLSFAIAIGFFLFTSNHLLRAIGLALIVFGATGLIIDHFSKVRADTYYKALTTEIGSRP
ncbi:MAG: hypothetical protein MUF75_01490 [Bacteroidia bacterium]|jgi:hypothetical protein|nr:hypothetical protein [Bacteroidia bacterium]